MDAAGPDGSLFIPFRACAAAFRGNEQAQMLVRLRLTSVDAAAAAVAETQRRAGAAAQASGEKRAASFR